MSTATARTRPDPQAAEVTPLHPVRLPAGARDAAIVAAAEALVHPHVMRGASRPLDQLDANLAGEWLNDAAPVVDRVLATLRAYGALK